MFDIIIVGAGASGLIAMKELLEQGYRVCMLEASKKAGGRIDTISNEIQGKPIEKGAEFIHGKLPLTLQLLDEANIEYAEITGKIIGVIKGEWNQQEEHDKHWDLFLQKLNTLQQDCSLSEFLGTHFSEPVYSGLRNAVRRYAEGFDLADITTASVKAAGIEWTHEQDTQYRVKNGYCELINYLLDNCNQQHGTIYYNAVVNRIEYTAKAVTAFTAGGERFEAKKILVTVSAGILQLDTIQFKPAIPGNYLQAIHQLGFGSVIKILLSFKTAFWEDADDDIGFIISDEPIPTWWTQLPVKSNLLTGWLGGPSAKTNRTGNDELLLEDALFSLSRIFKIPVHTLQQLLAAFQIVRWDEQPFVKGGYSFITTESVNAKKILAHSIDDTVFFAGEACCRGSSQGTVEAALQSGLETAKKIITTF